MEQEDISLERLKQENVASHLSNVSVFCDLMHQLRPNWRNDEALVAQTESWLKEGMFGPEACPTPIQWPCRRSSPRLRGGASRPKYT